MNEQPKELLGEVISRATMGVVGLAMLFGGWKCLAVAYRICQEYLRANSDQFHQYQYYHGNAPGSGAGLPAIIGAALVFLGIFFTAAARVSMDTLTKWFGTRPPTVFDGAEESQARDVASKIRSFNRF